MLSVIDTGAAGAVIAPTLVEGRPEVPTAPNTPTTAPPAVATVLVKPVTPLRSTARPSQCGIDSVMRANGALPEVSSTRAWRELYDRLHVRLFSTLEMIAI